MITNTSNEVTSKKQYNGRDCIQSDYKHWDTKARNSESSEVGPKRRNRIRRKG